MSVSVEIERKYVISKPDVAVMASMPEYTVSEITQVYMPTVGGVSHRIRKRSGMGETVFTETKKTRIDSMSVYEDEHQISETEYGQLLLLRDTSLNIITKTRHTFRVGELIVEIDVYPEWKHTCIMETELPNRATEIEFPDFIKIVREVTGIKKYTNHSMSRSFPAELTCDTFAP